MYPTMPADFKSWKATVNLVDNGSTATAARRESKVGALISSILVG
jgi:hypothetical protein